MLPEHIPMRNTMHGHWQRQAACGWRLVAWSPKSKALLPEVKSMKGRHFP
jgi:hypothetical protein